MIIEPFTIEALETYKFFYVLKTISDTDVLLYRRTPAGDDPFEHATVFIMNNGKLVVSLKNPYTFSANACLIAKSQDIEEIVNLAAWEHISDVYNTSIENTDQGVFKFIGSTVMAHPTVEWRCTNTMYGALPFGQKLGETVITSLDDLVLYEILLSVHNVGYLVYVHMKNDEILREEHRNNSVIPATGFTLSEAFKLMHEWAEVTKAPFNNTEPIALAAKEFLDTFGFTPDLVDNQVDMQVANYLNGSTEARLRPTSVQPNKPELIEFLKKNMASTSLAALCAMYPGLWDMSEVLAAEKVALAAGVARFRAYWHLPDDCSMDDWDSIKQYCKKLAGPMYIESAVTNQLRMLANKQATLAELS